jgi:hypothetical protein
VCGEIDNKFELLLVDGNILEDIQIVSIWNQNLKKLLLLVFSNLNLQCICLVIGEFCCFIFTKFHDLVKYFWKWILTFCIMKNIVVTTKVIQVCSPCFIHHCSSVITFITKKNERGFQSLCQT